MPPLSLRGLVCCFLSVHSIALRRTQLSSPATLCNDNALMESSAKVPPDKIHLTHL